MPKQVAVLFASMTADARFKNETESLQQLLDSRGVPFLMIDGTAPDMKEVRNKLFEVCGKRAIYPQVFTRDDPSTDDSVTMPSASEAFAFVGDWESISSANERNEREGAFDALWTGITRVTPGTGLIAMVTAAGLLSSRALGGGAQAPSATDATPKVAIRVKSYRLPNAAPGLSPARPVSAAREPPEVSAWIEKTAAGGDKYWWNPITKETSWLDPRLAVRMPSEGAAAPPSWIPATDDVLRPYYYNFRTGESRWILA